MDDEWCLDILYKAELDTSEDPELLELAREMVDEDPETRGVAIEELREMVYERGECSPRRLDDAFLLRFLRARKFVVRRAHRLLVRYCQFLEQYPELYQGVDLWGLAKVGGAYEGTNYDRPDIGRLTIMRFGTWDPSDIPIEELVKAGVAMTEIGIRMPRLQVLGGALIVDLEGITMRHVSTLTPTIVYQIMCLSGMATPITGRSYHFINYSWILHTFFYLFRRYMGPEVRSRTFFHGYDVTSLQRHIPLECLPARYGGSCGLYHNTFGFWLNLIKRYRDESFDKEMKEFGYLVKE